jgi:hypothetical protein
VRGALREQLLAIAHAFFALVGSPKGLSLRRMMLAAPRADAGLRETFWNAGPIPTHDALAAFLRACADTGQLRIDDADRAARQFFCLVKGDLHERLLCGLRTRPARGELEAHLQAAVDFFLRGYAPT